MGQGEVDEVAVGCGWFGGSVTMIGGTKRVSTNQTEKPRELQ